MTFPVHTFEERFTEQNGCAIVRLDPHTLQQQETALPLFPFLHKHDFYEIIYVINGRGTHTIDLTQYPIQPSSVYLIAPGQLHAWAEPVDIEGYVLLFTEHFLQLNSSSMQHIGILDWFILPEVTPWAVLTPELSQQVEQICADIMHDYYAQEYGRILMLQLLIQMLLIRLQRMLTTTYHHQWERRGYSTVQAFISLIERHFKTQHMVHEYAQQLSITPGYLNELVHQETGRSAGALIRYRLLLEAKRLLVHSHSSIQDIAIELGFREPTYFSRFFKQALSMTPQTFRTQTRQQFLNA